MPTNDNLNKHRIFPLLLAMFVLIAALAACAQTGVNTTATTAANSNGSSTTTSTSSSSSTSGNSTTASAISVKFTEEDQNLSWTADSAETITLNGSAITATGNVSINGSTAVISTAGTFIVSGTLNDGQILVQAGDDDIVRIILNGVNLTGLQAAPINIESAKKVVLILADGTQNTIVYGTTASTFNTDQTSDTPNAAIYSKADLTLNGSGALTVISYAGHGIVSKDKLKILGGSLDITSAGDGIKGRDCVAISAGTISINAEGDGIQSNNDEDAAKGFVYIAGGTVTVVSSQDGIQAETNLLVNGGLLNITTQGYGDDSAKGLKAVVSLAISAGDLTIYSTDDTIHANGSITISGGTLSLSSGDDGIHADGSVTIDGGDITILKAYEGIESAEITLNNGNITMTTSDDGINGSSGTSSGGGGPGGFGGGGMNASDGSQVTITGGTLIINAGGDGLDSNGSVTQTGGTVIIDGPTNDGNGAIDYNGTYELTGGYVLAIGSSGMAEAPDTSSTQYIIQAFLTQTLSAGTEITIEDASGNTILSYQSAKQFSSVVFSSADLQKGGTYKLYTNGSLQATVTLSSILTTSGTGGMGGGKRH